MLAAVMEVLEAAGFLKPEKRESKQTHL